METILKYWRSCEERGAKPKAVYAVVMVTDINGYPAGAIRTWSLSRKEMKSWIESFTYTATFYRLAKIVQEG